MRTTASPCSCNETLSAAFLEETQRSFSEAVREDTGEHPKISVIIPVRNGAATLEACLKAVFRSHYPNFEVIVVNDASLDDSAAIAAGFPCGVVTLEAPSGPARARNVGVSRSHGSLLFFTDADVCILPDTLDKVAGSLTDRPNHAAMGSYTKETGKRNFVSRYKNYLHHFTHQSSRGQVSSFFTACGAIRRDAFENIGGFDESINGNALEDVDLGYRLYRSGAKIYLYHDLQVTHHKHYSLLSLLRSDIFERAIPYIRLMFRYRTFRRELSTKPHNVMSVALVSLLPLLAAAGLVTELYWATGLGLLAAALILLALNHRFYLFLRRQAGVAFMARGVLMHWWGYWYSGVGAAMGLLSSLSGSRPPAPGNNPRLVAKTIPVTGATTKSVNL